VSAANLTLKYYGQDPQIVGEEYGSSSFDGESSDDPGTSSPTSGLDQDSN
jgi:hypothetical protein